MSSDTKPNKQSLIHDVGSSYTLYQGTEWNNEKLDLLIVVNFELKKINRIDLENKKTKTIDIPEKGIPIHFKKISKSKFNELVDKYLFVQLPPTGKKVRVFKNPILKELRFFCAENCDKWGNLNALEVIDKINSIEDNLNASGEKQTTVITRLDSLNVGDKYKYNPNDVGIFKVIAKDEENWIKTVRTQSGRIAGGFPWTKVYPVNE